MCHNSTGKTHVSVTALKAMLASRHIDDPPIIISAQTNHALDQLLNHVLRFEKDVLRIGSRIDRANEEIRNRTLYELRATALAGGAQKLGASLATAKRELRSRINNIIGSMQSLTTGKILTSDILFENKIISQIQKDSLSEEGWGDGTGDHDSAEGDILEWLSEDQLISIPETPPINTDLDMEEDEEEYEKLAELGIIAEEENATSQEAKDDGGLQGFYIAFKRKRTGRSSVVSTQKLKKLLAKKNLFDVPKAYRGEIYRFWEKQLNEKMLQELKGHLREYRTACDRHKVDRELDQIKLVQFLKVKLIACTTTGLSKYRGFLSALAPRILVIEEAAETLEGTLIAGMFDSLQQLILVGDHQQLQAHCNVAELGREPYNLNISMFERLVNNGIEFVMLNRQRRMITEVRELLTIEPKPFYQDLYDHASVVNDEITVNRAPIAGMGKLSTWFCNHNFPETQNADGSWLNYDEADMVAGFYNYLILNGNEPTNITILTVCSLSAALRQNLTLAKFYHGQRRTLLRALRKIPNLRQYVNFQVQTVDSYQGEENDIVILSLVRCNERSGIGFLTNKNRVVVALSRARRGFYIFGSALTLKQGERLHETLDDHIHAREPLWSLILAKMRQQGRLDVDAGLPITCQSHGKVTHIHEPDDWLGTAGGCMEMCGEILDCGHECPHRCHPFAHSSLSCPAPCSKVVISCGHYCSAPCGEACFCWECTSPQPSIKACRGENSSDALRSDLLPEYPLIWDGSSRSRQFTSFDIRKEPHDEHSTPKRSPRGISNNKLDHGNCRLSKEDRLGVQNDRTTIADWKNFDAQAEDQKCRERIAAKTTADMSKMVIEETWKRTEIDENDKRVVVETRVAEVHRDDDSFANSVAIKNNLPKVLQISKLPLLSSSLAPSSKTIIRAFTTIPPKPLWEMDAKPGDKALTITQDLPIRALAKTSPKNTSPTLISSPPRKDPANAPYSSFSIDILAAELGCLSFTSDQPQVSTPQHVMEYQKPLSGQIEDIPSLQAENTAHGVSALVQPPRLIDIAAPVSMESRSAFEDLEYLIDFS